MDERQQSLSDRPIDLLAVIPSIGRPQLVRAVASVLAQRNCVVETIVVVQEQYKARTVALLEEFPTDAVRLLTVPDGTMGGAGRDIATKAEQHDWVAYLDDDDEWLPDKTVAQVALAEVRGWEVVSSRFVARVATSNGDRSGASADSNANRWSAPIPRTLIGAGENVGDYLFRRRRLSLVRNSLHTSTLLMRQHTAIDVGWSHALQRHQDWDFVLRLAARRPEAEREGSVAAVFGHHPAVLTRVELGASRLSASDAWRASFDWFELSRPLLSRCAASDFLVGQVGRYAVQSRSLLGLRTVFDTLPSTGRPSIRAFALMLSGLVSRELVESIWVRVSSLFGRRTQNTGELVSGTEFLDRRG